MSGRRGFMKRTGCIVAAALLLGLLLAGITGYFIL